MQPASPLLDDNTYSKHIHLELKLILYGIVKDEN